MSGERRDSESGRGRIAHWLVAGLAAALVAGVLPAMASAQDYCVAPNTSCGGTNVATLEQALDLADNATDADRIFLGAATYTAPTTDGYFYDKPDSPVEIVGEGTGQTILTTPAPPGDGVISLKGGTGSSIHDLTIRLPQNEVGGGSRQPTRRGGSRWSRTRRSRIHAAGWCCTARPRWRTPVSRSAAREARAP